jgi:hypothetical protein
MGITAVYCDGMQRGNINCLPRASAAGLSTLAYEAIRVHDVAEPLRSQGRYPVVSDLPPVVDVYEQTRP